jgi:hypothetical protein
VRVKPDYATSPKMLRTSGKNYNMFGFNGNPAFFKIIQSANCLTGFI